MREDKPPGEAAERTPDHAGVRVPPPLIFLGFLLAGLWVDSPWFAGQMAAPAATAAGGLVAAIGIALILAAAWPHKKAGTNLEPWKPTTAIITGGLYRYSRNPIYLGMAIVHAGLAVAGGSLVALASLAGSVAVIQFYVIAREERYLEAKFGKAYGDYKARVRPWI